MSLIPRARKHVWRVSQVGGRRRLAVQATQLDDRGIERRSEARMVLREWVEFLSTEDLRIRDIEFVSRVPQELLDAVGHQRQLKALAVKWGPYSDLSALSALARLRDLRLGSASAVQDLTPLMALPAIETLAVEGAHLVRDLRPLGELAYLRVLTLGDGYPGSHRVVDLADLAWLRPLRNPRELALPGTRIEPEELVHILELPRLRALRLPLRRSYRALVFEYARSNRAFAGVAREYEAVERSGATSG